MKSNQKFSKKWKWFLIGGACAIVAAGGMSLAIALASENKSLKSSSSYFVGQNAVDLLYKNLNQNGYDSLPAPNDLSEWTKFADNSNFHLVNYNDPSQLSSLENQATFSTYRINRDSISNLDPDNKNLLAQTAKNAEQLLGNQPIKLDYNTLDSAAFFNSKVDLFTDSVINSVKDATNNKINIVLVPRSPTTAAAEYNNMNCELGSLFWEPDYNDVSAWIGYLFSQNDGWLTGNLWPCLWDLLAGANPANGQFTYNGQALPDSNLTYTNAVNFDTQLEYTNMRRQAMGLGNLPAWAVSLYQTLYNNFPNSIAWNTNYGWWPLQYNNNGESGLIQYVIQNWCASVENTDVVISSNNIPYNLKNPLAPSFYDNLSISDVGSQYTSTASLIPFISWIDDLTPSLPFYLNGDNLSEVPALSQKGIYPLFNPANSYINGTYFINRDGLQYSYDNPFVYFIAGSVVNSLNFNYFASALGSQTFHEDASGLFSGLLGYVPYNFYSNETGSNQYSAGYGITNKKDAVILKAFDANNFALYETQSNFVGAHYANNSIDHGDTLQDGKNAKMVFISNPEVTLNPNAPQTLLTQSQYEATTAYKNHETWSSYTNYENFVKYHELTLTDGNLASAITKTDAYTFYLNKKVNWVNEQGKVVGTIEPSDFNQSLTWTAASMSDYSYDGNGNVLGEVNSDSYMLQEIGIAGNNYNLGVGSGFFQTEEYAPNSDPNGDTFTYFLSPNSITKKDVANGWSKGTPVSYFLSMLGTQTGFFTPMPTNVKAFHSLPAGNPWTNLTMAQLTQDFMGNSPTTGVWNVSQEMAKALASNNNAEFKKLYNQMAQNPAYVSLVANMNIAGESGVLYLYGSATNPVSGLPQMSGNLEFNGGYFANANTFTNSTLRTQIIPSYFDNAMVTPAGGYILGPSSQKINYIKYKWSGNITREELLVLYTSNQISMDFDIDASQLKTLTLTGNQALYFRGVVSDTQLNTVIYNAQIYNLTSDAATGFFNVPLSTDGQPLIQIDTNANAVANYNTMDDNGQSYTGKYGYPYLDKDGNVLYTNSDHDPSLKSYDSKSYESIVGTVLNPFIYGTTGAAIRQDINALVNWTAVADNAAYPLTAGIIANNIIPYGNFTGNFEYKCPTTNQPVVVHTFYQYVAATTGVGLLGASLYWTYGKNNYYYVENQSKGIDDYTQYEWDMINAINNWS